MKHFYSCAFFVLTLLCCTQLNGQLIERSVYSTAGGTFDLDKFHFSWTLGEPCVQTITTSDYVFTEGFQQADIISRENSEEEAVNIFSSDDIVLYPNPTVQDLFLEIKNEGVENVVLTIFDAQGSLISKTSIDKSTNNHHIDMSVYPSGLYLLVIQSPDQTSLFNTRITKL